MLKNLIKTMRPRQWTKNLVVLAGLVFDGQMFMAEPLKRAVFAMVLFCLVSGVTYIVNDLLDIEADRQHPQKRLRPLASGELSVRTASVFAILLAAVVFTLAFLLSWRFGLVCAAYFVLMIVYSRWLKHMPLIDVMTIAAGFVLRVTAGLLVITVAYFSPWLFVLTTLLALFLGFGKRRTELMQLDTQAIVHRKAFDGYTIPLLDNLITVILSATLITYSLYTFSPTVTPDSHAMMFTIPFVLYGLLRYLFLLHVKKVGGAPEEVLLTDRPMQATLLLWGAAVVVILYILG